MITVDQLQHIAPANKDISNWCDTLNNHLEQYEINSPLRLSAFLAQTSHESGDFNILSENLYYRSETLMNIWPNHFPTLMIAEHYQMQPEKIANRVYANRLGNGLESSGDGWKYRGRGLIGITGRAEYISLANYLKVSLEDCVNYLSSKDGAVESSCWFWKTKNLNTLADKKDIVAITKIINGGLIGLVNRQYKYKLALDVIK